MSRLFEMEVLYGGGPGSGCHGPSCGRPATGVNKMVRRLRKTGLKIRKTNTIVQIRKTYKLHEKLAPVRKAHEMINKKVAEKAAKLVPKHLKQYPLPEPQLSKIDPQPVKKRDIKKQMTLDGGIQLTILKPAGQYDKTNQSWLKKVSAYKGQYHRLYVMDQFGDQKTKNSVWVYRDAKRGQMIQVSRHLGSDKGVTVKEVDTMDFEHIMRTREVGFNNIGRASGFLAKRYGITFRLGGRA